MATPYARKPIKRVWIAPVAVGAVTLAGAVFGLTRKDPEPVTAVVASTSNDCEPVDAKLAGIWDRSLRSRVATRFADARTPAVDVTWRVVSAELDHYAQRWSTQWTAACAATDRESDFELYTQRLTCLENAVLALRGATSSLAQADPAAFSEGYTGSLLLRTLADCETVSVVRRQAAAPTLDKRERIAKLVVDVERARHDLRTAFAANLPEKSSDASARLEDAAKALDQLGVPEAAIGAYWSAHALTSSGRPLDATTITRVRAELDAAATRAIKGSDDPWLVWVRAAQLGLERRHGDASQIDGALARLSDAVVRAGNPLRGRRDLVAHRYAIAIARGHLEQAQRDLEELSPLTARLEMPGLQHFDAIALHLRAERRAEAVALARQRLEQDLRRWGAEHRYLRRSRGMLKETLLNAGDLRGAGEELDAIRALDLPTERNGTLYEATLVALVDGDLPRAKARFDAISDDRETRFLTLVERAHLHHVAAPLRWVTEHSGFEKWSKDHRGQVATAAAFGAYRENDATTIGRLLPFVQWTADSTMLELLADTLQGRVAKARRMLFIHTIDDPVLSAVAIGMVRRAERDWSSAIEAFTRALAGLRPKGAPDHRSGELETYLGEARLERGEAKEAIPSLENAIEIARVTSNGLGDYTPAARFALARALWLTGGDKARARRLAERARDDFAKLRGHAADREAAIRWLAEHAN